MANTHDERYSMKLVLNAIHSNADTDYIKK